MKKITLYAWGALLALLFLLQTPIVAQNEVQIPASSPREIIKQEFAQSNIEVNYSRPSKKGRKIFGDLIPYGKMWRTGANESTKIKFGSDVKLEGNLIPAGEYALYTVPGATEWEIIIHKNTSHWGDGYGNYKKDEDLIRFKVKSQKVSPVVETFTIDFDKLTGSSGELVLLWDNVRVPVKMSIELGQIFADIEKQMEAAPNKPFYGAVNFYLDNNGDMKKALVWSDGGIQKDPKAYWMWQLKAKVQMKLGDKAGAVESLMKSNEVAQAALSEDPDAKEYISMNNKMMADLKKK